jgi:hypothetical protein
VAILSTEYVGIDACLVVNHTPENFKIKLNGRECSFLRKMYAVEQRFSFRRDKKIIKIKNKK